MERLAPFRLQFLVIKTSSLKETEHGAKLSHQNSNNPTGRKPMTVYRHLLKISRETLLVLQKVMTVRMVLYRRRKEASKTNTYEVMGIGRHLTNPLMLNQAMRLLEKLLLRHWGV